MARTLKPDRILFLVTLSLAALGVAMVFSSSAVLAQARFANPNFYLFKQLLASALGFAVLFVLMKVDYRLYRRPAVVFSIVAFVVALLVVAFFGAPVANTHRWIQFPGFSVQPSEIAKLGLVCFLAYFLEKRKAEINDFWFTLVPIAVVSGLMTGLIIFQPDFGTAVSLLIVAGVLLLAAGLNTKWLTFSAMFGLPLSYLLFYFFVYRVDWRWKRIEVFWDPWTEPLGKGYQMIQSLISVGTGGLSGLGYMEGKQKLFFLPEPHTDFIFSVVAEEFGMIGACAVLVLFGVFFWRGVRASMRAPDLFGFYLALGITMMIAVQAFINISVSLGLMPTKGIPLPFLSYGGSSIVVALASVGILLNVSQQSS